MSSALCRAVLSACSSRFLHKLFHEFHLNLLNFQQSLSLVDNQVVELFIQMEDLEVGLEIDPIILLTPQTILGVPPVLVHHNNARLYGRKT